jgi:hypothetical protein
VRSVSASRQQSRPSPGHPLARTRGSQEPHRSGSTLLPLSDCGTQAVGLHAGRDLHSCCDATPLWLAKRRGLRGNRARGGPPASRSAANDRAEAELRRAHLWLPLRRLRGSLIQTAPLGVTQLPQRRGRGRRSSAAGDARACSVLANPRRPLGRRAAAPELAATRRPLPKAMRRPLIEGCDGRPRDCVPMHGRVCACLRSTAWQTAIAAVGLELGSHDRLDRPAQVQKRRCATPRPRGASRKRASRGSESGNR